MNKSELDSHTVILEAYKKIRQARIFGKNLSYTEEKQDRFIALSLLDLYIHFLSPNQIAEFRVLREKGKV